MYDALVCHYLRDPIQCDLCVLLSALQMLYLIGLCGALKNGICTTTHSMVRLLENYSTDVSPLQHMHVIKCNYKKSQIIMLCASKCFKLVRVYRACHFLTKH